MIFKMLGHLHIECGERNHDVDHETGYDIEFENEIKENLFLPMRNERKANHVNDLMNSHTKFG